MPPSTDSVCELLTHLDRSVPVDACIGDTDTLLEGGKTLSRVLLRALVDVRLEHNTDNLVLTLTELVTDDLCDLRLVLVVLLRVAWRMLGAMRQY